MWRFDFFIDWLSVQTWKFTSQCHGVLFLRAHQASTGCWWNQKLTNEFSSALIDILHWRCNQILDLSTWHMFYFDASSNNNCILTWGVPRIMTVIYRSSIQHHLTHNSCIVSCAKYQRLCRALFTPISWWICTAWSKGRVDTYPAARALCILGNLQAPETCFSKAETICFWAVKKESVCSIDSSKPMKNVHTCLISKINFKFLNIVIYYLKLYNIIYSYIILLGFNFNMFKTR